MQIGAEMIPFQPDSDNARVGKRWNARRTMPLRLRAKAFIIVLNTNTPRFLIATRKADITLLFYYLINLLI